MNQSGQRQPRSLSSKLKFWGIMAVVVIVVGWLLLNGAVGWNPLGKMQLIEYKWGSTGFKKDMGFFMKAWGECNEFPMIATVARGSYKGEKGQKEADVPRVNISFQGAAKAQQSYLARIALPQTEAQIKAIKQKFPGGFRHFMEKGLIPDLDMAVRTAANLTEPEEALNNIASFRAKAHDQMVYGLYQTMQQIVIDTNAAGEEERRAVTVIKQGPDGKPTRDSLTITKYGCMFENIQVSLPKFDPDVDSAIAERRKQQLAAETAKKQRIAAEQQKLAAEAKGQKDVIEERYKKEVAMAGVVSKANMQKQADSLEAAAARFQFIRDSLQGEGEYVKRSKVLKADGYLEKILKAEIKINDRYAQAIENYKGDWVPRVQMGGSGTGNGSEGQAATDMINLLRVQASQQIADAIERADQAQE